MRPDDVGRHLPIDLADAKGGAERMGQRRDHPNLHGAGILRAVRSVDGHVLGQPEHILSDHHPEWPIGQQPGPNPTSRALPARRTARIWPCHGRGVACARPVLVWSMGLLDSPLSPRVQGIVEKWRNNRLRPR